MKFSTSISDNISLIEGLLPLEKSSDLITRNLLLGQTKAYLICVNGLFDAKCLQSVFSDILNPLFNKNQPISCLGSFCENVIAYSQLSFETDPQNACNSVLSGPAMLLVDGFDRSIIIDCRQYPNRSINEPETEKVTRGAKDCFVESLTSNTALIRRRLRTGSLIFERIKVGEISKTDISVGYIKSLSDSSLVNKVIDKLSSLEISSVTMGSKSIEELLVKKHWYNPLPSILKSERPDVIASYLAEGYICVIVDTSPYVLVLPTTFFQFTQSPEDYYKNPIVGNYVRVVRFVCILLSLFVMPLFLLLANISDTLPQPLQMIAGGIHQPIRLFFYCIFVEFALDLFKYASAHAFQGFSNSMSIIGGLLISDIAIKLNWASLEVIFYGALTLLATLTMAYLEFGEALRIYRLVLLYSTGIGGTTGHALFGFIIGLALIFLSIITTRTFDGKSYFWPLCPLNFKALCRLFIRYTTPNAQPANIWQNSNDLPKVNPHKRAKG